MKKFLYIFLILIVGIFVFVLPNDIVQAANCVFSNCEEENPWGLQCGTSNGIPVFTGFDELFCCEGNGKTYATQEDCQVGACASIVVPPAGNGGGDGDGGNEGNEGNSGNEGNGGGGGPSIVSSGGSVDIKNPLEHDTFEALVDAIVKFVFYIAMAIAPLMFIVAGFFYLTAMGDPKKIETAHKVVMYTLIGLAICLMATGIIKLVNDVLGV